MSNEEEALKLMAEEGLEGRLETQVYTDDMDAAAPRKWPSPIATGWHSS